MRLRAECPRCRHTPALQDDVWTCLTHGELTPLWRAQAVDYDEFAEYLLLSRSLPTWMPWPLPPTWQVTDFGCVGGEGREPLASFVSCVGSSEVDGVVEMTVLTEEPGVGLGARCSEVDSDPGREAGVGSPALRLKLAGLKLPVWSVSTPETRGAEEVLDRTVLVGEAEGRWLWVVLRPASAVLLLRELPPLLDVSEIGPPLVGLPFGHVPPPW